MQPTRPVWSVYLPVGQFAHAGWNVWSCHMPTTHAMQLDLPVVAWRQPPGHPLHTVRVVWSVYDPVAQFLHPGWLSWFWNWPCQQTLQFDLPAAPCFHPFGQPLHFVDACDFEFW